MNKFSFKSLLIFLIAGTGIAIFGAVLKVMHLPMATATLVCGMLVETVAVIWLVVRLCKVSQIKSKQ